MSDWGAWVEQAQKEGIQYKVNYKPVATKLMAEHELKPTFLKIYANLPVGLRDEIIYVASKEAAKKANLPDGSPLTWNACWLEVKHDTPLSHNILNTLHLLQII